MPVNWCEELGTVLSNDEVIDGKSERGGYPVVRKNMKQWVIDQPAFAEKLLEGFALKVNNGTYSQKIVILEKYVRIVGITMIIDGIFAGAASIAGGQEVGAAIGGIILALIIGLIIVFISTKINDGKETVGDSIIWIILLIAFILLLIVSIFEIFTLIGIIDGIAHIIIALFMIAFLFDPEVKKKMNM